MKGLERRGLVIAHGYRDTNVSLFAQGKPSTKAFSSSGLDGSRSDLV